MRPCLDATSVASIAVHHSDGMLWRCHHLLTCDGLAPTSAAQASLVGQSSITASNDVGSDMDASLGQLVLNIKPKVSYDCGRPRELLCPMAEKLSKTAFQTDFKRRTKAARVARNLTQDGIAELLDIPQDQYKQYETRGLLPHDLIPRFLLATGVEWAWLYTGHGRGPSLAEIAPAPLKSSRNKRRSKAA